MYPQFQPARPIEAGGYLKGFEIITLLGPSMCLHTSLKKACELFLIVCLKLEYCMDTKHYSIMKIIVIQGLRGEGKAFSIFGKK